MKKRILTFALALCLGLSVPALAAGNDFVVENGVLVKYTGNSPVVVIPSNLGIREIGRRAFKDPTKATNLTEVVIPAGVTIIQDSAFEGCYALEYIKLPSTLEKIGKMAFWGCESLTELEIPEGVTSIGDYAFQECWGLEDITLPGSLTSIGKGAFESCYDCTLECPFDSYAHRWALEQAGQFIIMSPFDAAQDPAPTAYASTQNVLVDGKTVEFQCYALKDANGNDTNYIKLRDVAQILSGTAAQFAVTWDGAVNIVTGQPYTPNGSEMNTPFSGNRAYTVPTAQTKVNGAAAALDAIILTDDAGNGYTYYKLRDLGSALGFTVDWSAEKGIFIETA